MATKKMTVKKTAVPKPLQEIQELVACLSSSEDQLGKTYVKASAKIDTQLQQLNSKLIKAKKKLAVIKTKSKSISKKTKISAATLKINKEAEQAVQAVQTEIVTLKLSSDMIRQDHKKFLARQKLLSEFDKQWQKQIVKLAKAKKIKAKKKTATKDVQKPKAILADPEGAEESRPFSWITQREESKNQESVFETDND